MSWRRYVPTEESPWDFRRAKHLHRRASFGPTWKELIRSVEEGPEQSVDRLINGTSRMDFVPADYDEMALVIGDAAVSSGDPLRLKAWWFYRFLFSPDPLREQLTLMWHNHFATSNLKVDDLSLMREQNERFRKHAMGDFRTLLGEMMKDPALLVWLDANANRKENPNENLARELMELFTLGVGNYSEADIKNVARALTGWTVEHKDVKFKKHRFDAEPKEILGQKGAFDLDDVVQLLLESEFTADRLAWRLCDHFMGENVVDDECRQELADGLRSNGLNIGWAVETILRSELFYSDSSISTQVSSPVSFIAGTIRSLEILDPPPATMILASWCTRMGQDIFEPPNVGGWPGGRDWLNSRSIVPLFLNRSAFAADSAKSNGNILVVIQLSGGNDGINTVVPYQDEGYAKHRESLRLEVGDLNQLDEPFAFHPRLRSASELYRDGRLSVVHGVGYPNPNRSHFESMEIWHTAYTKKSQRIAGNGWLGDAVSLRPVENGPHAIHVGGGRLPMAVRGRRCTATSLSKIADLTLSMPHVISDSMPGIESVKGSSNGSLNDFVASNVASAYRSAKDLAESTKQDRGAQYPDSGLAQQLKVIANVIKSDAACRIYYTTQGGYDTHSDQLSTHANLLGTLSSSLKAFMNDLRDSGLDQRVLVLAFSEFGRRVDENASHGTDHGTAGPVFLAGTKLANRAYGQMPSLTDLAEGDLKHTTDFRDIYASVVSDWLQFEKPESLKKFGIRNMFRNV